MQPRRFLSGTILIIALLATSVLRADPPVAGFTDIAVRNNLGDNTERQAFEGDGSPSRAIDGDFFTATYLTTAFTSAANGPQHVYLNLGSSTNVYGFRWKKEDSYVDPHTISFLTSTDSGTLTGRSFAAVTGLANGYQGTELVNGNFSGNTISNESDGNGFYSVTFDGVINATAIRFDFAATGPYDHYHVDEFQAIVPEPATGVALLFAAVLSRRRLCA